jgi:hypothetical protein
LIGQEKTEVQGKMGMHGTCAKLAAIVVLLAGLSFMADYFGYWMMGELVGGLLLAIYGIMMLTHAMGMCGECNAAFAAKMKGKK